MKEILPGDIISYITMCITEGVSLQKGMNFRIKGKQTVILMSQRKGAPYSDMVEDNGRVLIYEGHDVPKNVSSNPKLVNQEQFNANGSLTENGKFIKAVVDYRNGNINAEPVKVYEKIKDGIWVFNGIFSLIDYQQKEENGRSVFKFRLKVSDFSSNQLPDSTLLSQELQHNRVIPTSVKLEVWQRDAGKCIMCGNSENLHFDHILPYSKGGTSLLASNIQLLCAKHNLSKGDKLI